MEQDTFPYLSLFVATAEQELVYVQRAGEQWGLPNGLSIDEFAAGNAALSVLPHASEGRITRWVLAPRDDPTTLDFKCSCSVYRRTAIIKRAEDSEPQETESYAIMAVLTPPQNRGKGYASLMMRLLHEILGSQTLPEGLSRPQDFKPAPFSVLYSGVGPKFYATCAPYSQPEGHGEDHTVGWVLREPESSTYTIPNETVASSGSEFPQGWRSVRVDEMAALWEDEKRFVASEVGAQAEEPRSAAFSILPSGGVEDYQRAIVSCLFKEVKPPMQVSAAASGDGHTVIAWTLSGAKAFKEPKGLTVTRFRASSAEGGKSALLGLIAVAAKHGLKDIEIWNMPEVVKDAAAEIGFEHKQRTRNLPSFKWYGPEKPASVAWLYNQKYCWC